MSNQTINLLWLYPDLLNLHGDRANVMAFERVAKMLGVELKVTKIVNLTDAIELENIDIVLLNPGELGTVLNAIKELEPKMKQIQNYIEQEKYIIAIGTTGAMFAKRIHTQDGKTYNGLGILDMECNQRNTVIGDDIYYKLKNDQEVIGSQIHMLDFEVSEKNALGKTVYGYGNNGTGLEGARNKNVIFTNALGPVFVKNPWLAESILTDIAKKKEIETKLIPIEDFEIEIQSFNSTKKFIEMKQAGKM